MSRRIAAALIAGLSIAAAPGRAQPNAPTPANAEPVLMPTVTHHAIRLGDEDVRYAATVRETVVADSAGRPQATLSSTAYVREGIASDARRPVLFVFNGGPGASSSPLHFGALGPRRRSSPDATGARPLINNPFSPLRESDLVFIDPVGTGFGRVLPGGDGHAYWSVEGDATAMLALIRGWLRDNGRASSPVYICGESYGTFRLATMMKSLGELKVAGLILISAMLDATATVDATGNDQPHVFDLPALAAAAWFHHRGDARDEPIDRLFDEVSRFAQSDYLVALQQGSRLPAAERDRIAERMAGWVGLPASTIARSSLRIDKEAFLVALLADKQLRIGRLDARKTGNAAELAAKRPPFNDPSMTLAAGGNDQLGEYFRGELRVPTARRYVTLAMDVNSSWNWRSGRGGEPSFYTNPTPHIGAAMAAQPAMRILLLGGYFDLATPLLAGRYALDHAGVPPNRVTVAAFPGGHSFYDDEANLRELSDDVRAFLSGARVASKTP